ncbi:MAG TPA: phospholipid carrier-dependent glycosyltransferase [Candidatus Acidoferrales bacterium]|nr:phospholipid carrier-dependent glycosyltransferase [Candidatus Acidoferrales bacterium]
MGAAVAIVICLFGQLGAIGLTGPDEPRYAWIARAMARTGDWVTPRLYGQPWFEKPVLYYWAAGLGFRLHLPAEWAARLPSAIAALAAALAIAWLARRHYRATRDFACNPALIAPLLFALSVAAIGFARAATPDMLFTATLTLAMASAAAVLEGASAGAASEARSAPIWRDAAPLALFGAFLGLAVLAKGPAGVILAGGAVLLWALIAKRWRQALRLGHPIAIAAFLAVATPWYALCAARNPSFLHVFILEHNFERYLTPLFQHRQPFWFFGPILLLALLPWTALLFPAGREGIKLWRERRWGRSPGFFFACWAIFPLVFFSFSESKLPGYILPAIPPLALLLGIALTRLFRQRSRWLRWIFAFIGLTWIILGLTAGLWLRRVPAGARADIGHAIWISAGVAIAAGIAIIVLGALRPRDALLLSLGIVVLFVEMAGAGILPPLDPYVSARWHANLMRNDLHPNRIFTFGLQRSWNYGLAFYFGRELPEWSASDPAPALVLTTPAGLRQIRADGRFRGELEESERGILYVPVRQAPLRR